MALWNIDTTHAQANFAARHMMITTVRGSFNKITGTINFDPANPSAASVEAIIDTTTMSSTGNDQRDGHLKSPDFLDIEKYPTITFQSKKVEAAGVGKLKVTGDLTMHGVTKEVVLDVDGPAIPADSQGGPRMGASATTKINRQDYGINGAPGVAGDEITITLDIEMIKNK